MLGKGQLRRATAAAIFAVALAGEACAGTAWLLSSSPRLQPSRRAASGSGSGPSGKPGQLGVLADSRHATRS